MQSTVPATSATALGTREGTTPRRRRIAALGLGVTLAVGALIGASPTTAVAVDNGYYTVIVTDQDHYEGQTWTAFQMQDEGINAGPAPENFSEYDTSTMTEAFAVNASVPENFRYNGGAKKSDYIYQSAYWALERVYCSGTPRTCKVVDRYEVILKQTLSGGRTWTMTPIITKKFGPASASFSYSLYCGVNKPLQTDTLCAGGGAGHSKSGVFDPGNTVSQAFGAANNRVYPMMSISALWSNATAHARFRGYDVCNSSNLSTIVKLCSKAY